MIELFREKCDIHSGALSQSAKMAVWSAAAASRACCLHCRAGHGCASLFGVYAIPPQQLPYLVSPVTNTPPLNAHRPVALPQRGASTWMRCSRACCTWRATMRCGRRLMAVQGLVDQLINESRTLLKPAHYWHELTPRHPACAPLPPHNHWTYCSPRPPAGVH